MPEDQDSTSERQYELTPFEQKIKMNLYDSFLHSQGGAGLQLRLHEYLVRQYKKTLPQTSINFTAIHQEILKLRPPKLHNRGDGMSEFEYEFASLGVLLDKDAIRKLPFRQRTAELLQHEIVTFSDNTDQELVTDITKMMLERDNIFVHGGRFDTKSNPDRFRSFIKDFAIDGHPTRSDEFNALYKDIGNFLLRVHSLPEEQARSLTEFTYPSGNKGNFYDKIKELETYWEEKHPGQSFFPKTGQ